MFVWQVFKYGTIWAYTGEPRELLTANGGESKLTHKVTNQKRSKKIASHRSGFKYVQSIYIYGKVGPALRDVAASHPEEVAAAGEVRLSYFWIYLMINCCIIIHDHILIAHPLKCFWTLSFSPPKGSGSVCLLFTSALGRLATLVSLHSLLSKIISTFTGGLFIAICTRWFFFSLLPPISVPKRKPENRQWANWGVLVKNLPFIITLEAILLGMANGHFPSNHIIIF